MSTVVSSTHAERLAQLTAAALRQPGARERASGIIKFACPVCVADGHDNHQDNAGLFADLGSWGCAFAKDTPDGRRHWDAIGRALGAFDRRNGHGDRQDAQSPRDADTERRSDAAAAAAVDWPLYDAAELWDFPPVEFTVEGLLPRRGVVWIGGLPKKGKSLLMLYVALAIARGVVVARHFPVLAQPRILYIAAEDGGPRLQERRDEILAAWGGARPAPAAVRFLIRPMFDLLDPAHVAWLRDLCQVEDITLVILDTWTRLSPTADPMAARDQARLAAIVIQLAQDIDGAVAVVDHSRKNRPDGQPLSSADIFGPLQKWAAADHVVMLDATGDPHRLEIFVEGKDGDGGRFFLDISPHGSCTEKFTFAGTVAEIADAQRAIGDQNRENVLAVVLAAGQPVSLSDVVATLAARGTPLAPRTVQTHLTALNRARRLIATGKGRATRYSALAKHAEAPSSANEHAPQETLHGDDT